MQVWPPIWIYHFFSMGSHASFAISTLGSQSAASNHARISSLSILVVEILLLLSQNSTCYISASMILIGLFRTTIAGSRSFLAFPKLSTPTLSLSMAPESIKPNDAFISASIWFVTPFVNDLAQIWGHHHRRRQILTQKAFFIASQVY